MNKGSQLLLGCGLVATAAVASIPWWVGREVEQQFTAQFSHLQQQLKERPEVSLALQSYRQGYLSSTAMTAFTITPALSEPVSVVVRHQISHGPYVDGQFEREVAAKIVSVVVPDSEQQRTMSQFYFSDRAPFEMMTMLKWSGEVMSHGEIPAYVGRDHSGEYDLKWGGLKFESSGDWVAMRGSGKFNAPRFELTNASEGITIGGFKGRFRTFMSPQRFGLGDGEFSLALIKLRGGSGPQQMVLSDVSVKYDAKQQNGLVNVMQQLGFRLLEIDKSKFNAGLLKFELNNLDAVTLQALQQRYEILTASRLSDEVELQQWWLTELQRVLPALLQKAPELHVSRAEVMTVDGQVSVRFKLASEPAPADFRLVDMGADLTSLLPLLQFELDLKLPAKIIEQQARSVAREKIVAQLQEQEQIMTPLELAQQTRRAAEQMLTQFEIQNIIQRAPAHYTTKLRFEKGRLLLNGVPADNLLHMLPPLKGS